MADAQNGIVGENYDIDIPETLVDDKQLNEEKKIAKYSRSAEFKKIQDHMQARIEFYQKSLPNGEPIYTLPMAERGQAWSVANTVISEFQNVINFYEQAAEIVKEAESK